MNKTVSQIKAQQFLPLLTHNQPHLEVFYRRAGSPQWLNAGSYSNEQKAHDMLRFLANGNLDADSPVAEVKVVQEVSRWTRESE